MLCMKCGVSVSESQVFCENCLKDMERYPVKTNVQVNIPVRPVAPSSKKRSRRQRGSAQDELVRALRIKLRLAHTALIVVMLAFFALAAIMVRYLSETPEQVNTGQNYSTMPTTEPT